MRDRWQIISHLWDTKKQPVNKLNLLGQLDYYGKLSAQLEWQQILGDRPFVSCMADGAGQRRRCSAMTTQWLTTHCFGLLCKVYAQEAHYLLAIINSDALYKAVEPLMPKGQFGARHLQKHLWKLPIPEFDPAVPLHAAIADAGQAAATGAAQQLAALRATRPRLTVTIARRELRKWLRTSPEGQAVEDHVAKLLEGQ